MQRHYNTYLTIGNCQVKFSLNRSKFGSQMFSTAEEKDLTFYFLLQLSRARLSRMKLFAVTNTYVNVVAALRKVTKLADFRAHCTQFFRQN